MADGEKTESEKVSAHAHNTRTNQHCDKYCEKIQSKVKYLESKGGMVMLGDIL